MHSYILATQLATTKWVHNIKPKKNNNNYDQE